MTTPVTPKQAREAADLYRATGTPVSVTAVYSLADQVEALTKERDAYEKCADDMAASHKVERDALKDAARLALDALDAVEIDERHYLTKCSKAIAALKAVL